MKSYGGEFCDAHANGDECLQELERIHFPVGRRQDSDIPTLDAIAAEPCTYAKLKYLICALRRGKKEYWSMFDSLVRENVEEFSKTLNVRWLVSVCDTYVDYGQDCDAAGAMAVSSLNFYATLSNAIYHGGQKADPKGKIVGKACSVPYYTSFMYDPRNDFFENYLRRLTRVGKNSKVIWPLMQSFLKQHKQDATSLIGYVYQLNHAKFPPQAIDN